MRRVVTKDQSKVTQLPEGKMGMRAWNPCPLEKLIE
jgi:hypothetical protein